MAEFLTTSGVSYQIESIIKEAKKKLILISPYIQISKVLLERLQNASEKGVEIRLIYGKNELKPFEKEQLNSIENLKLYFYQNLHAKCYFNEKTMVITSMNLYEFSEKHNREMGVLIKKNDDLAMFNDAVEEALSIVKTIRENVTSTTTATITKGILIFPLKREEYKIIQSYFEMNFNHSEINSTDTYVFCTDLFPFGNLMIREGFEIRMFHNLYSETALVNRIKSLKLDNLNYIYTIDIIEDKWSSIKILISPTTTFDLDNLLIDFEKIYYLIVSETKKISYKQKRVFM
jgi:sugar-specific transcriptional regulator TrmB